MTNIHIYPSFITNESRILKETKSIISDGFVKTIFILGFWKEGLLKKEPVTEAIDIIRLNCYVNKIQNLKFLNTLPFAILYLKFILFSIRHRVKVINCHTLTLLPVCVLVKFITGARLVYDPHELETETHDSSGLRKVIARFIERSLIQFADHTIVVSDSIKEWYKCQYALTNIDVVKNIPSMAQQSIRPRNIKESLGVGDQSLLFIYQGFLSESRGVGVLIDVFSSIQFDKHIVFMGFGPLEQRIKGLQKTTTNIHYLPPASPSELLSFTAGADVGIHIIQNTCLNHWYCLPNKVFEYVSAGIPFLVSDFPDIRKEFESKDLAWFVNPDAKSLKSVMQAITYANWSEKKQNCIASNRFWSWENQGLPYRNIYRKFVRN